MNQPARTYEFALPIGLMDADGTLHRQAAIRKMRGHEEALLYDRELGPGELVSHLVAGTLLRLGGLETPDPETVARMYSADRNYVLLQVRRVTLGDELPASYRCPGCAAHVRVLERLSELPVRSLDEREDPEGITLELDDGYTDRRGTQHRGITLRLPRGEDEAAVSRSLERDPVKAADALTLRCVQRFGTLPLTELQSYGLRILRDLSLGDRQRIQRALSDDAPGARLRRVVHCDACGTRFERVLDVSDFFVPRPAEGTVSGRRSSTWPTTSTGPGARSWAST